MLAERLSVAKNQTNIVSKFQSSAWLYSIPYISVKEVYPSPPCSPLVK